jgi:hypothetical protein
MYALISISILNCVCSLDIILHSFLLDILRTGEIFQLKLLTSAFIVIERTRTAFRHLFRRIFKVLTQRQTRI